MKHAVMCTEDGLIAAHGIIERKAEDEFESVVRRGECHRCRCPRMSKSGG
jgi:hypothetical protein